MGVTAEIRHRQIVEQLNLAGRVSVTELSKILRVTKVTIRRDLKLLAKSGLLKKTYGGAVLVGPGLQVSVRYRHTQNPGAKKIIGKLASDLINDGDIIYLEAGSTCYEIIPHIANRQGLTVIVNSLYFMHRLHELTGHKVVIVGGQYRSERMDMVGSLAEANIAQLGGFKAFTGADDITIEAGISGADVVTVGFAKLVLKRASEVIFVGDHTKFDKPALYKIADIDALDCIVTDIKPSRAWHRAAKENNIRLIYSKDKK